MKPSVVFDLIFTDAGWRLSSLTIKTIWFVPRVANIQERALQPWQLDAVERLQGLECEAAL